MNPSPLMICQAIISFVSEVVYTILLTILMEVILPLWPIRFRMVYSSVVMSYTLIVVLKAINTNFSFTSNNFTSPISPQRSLKAFVNIFQILITPFSFAVIIVLLSCQTT